MARIAFALLVGAAASAQAAVVVPPQAELKSVSDRLHTTVVEIRAQSSVPVAGELSNYGTGVLIGNGLAVTTLHTVGTIEDGKLQTAAHVDALIPAHGPAVADLVAWFPDLDLAILRLEGTTALTAAPFAAEVPPNGEPLVAMGTDEDSITVVGVTLAAANEDQLLLSSTRRVDSRFWGGPVFDVRGELVGITIPSLSAPKALSAGALRKLLDEVQKDPKDATASPSASTE
jgi:S1-C subfamily serine protease